MFGLVAPSPPAKELFLEVHHDELVKESEEVAGVPSMPDSQEAKGSSLADVSIVQKLESLVDVSRGPGVCVDVERLDDVTKRRGGLEPAKLYIGAASPVGRAIRTLALVA